MGERILLHGVSDGSAIITHKPAPLSNSRHIVASFFTKIKMVVESERVEDTPLLSTLRTATVALISCGWQLLAMKFLVLLAMGVAVTQASSCSGLKDDRSLLSSLLTVAGYSDTCVAAALDSCRTRQEDSRYTSLVEVSHLTLSGSPV